MPTGAWDEHDAPGLVLYVLRYATHVHVRPQAEEAGYLRVPVAPTVIRAAVIIVVLITRTEVTAP